MIEVVCGIIVSENGSVLIGKRPFGKHLGGKWEFPGGKVKLKENQANAIQRELLEELGCSIEIVFQMKCVHHVYDNGIAITMTPFVCKLKNAEEKPKALEHSSITWASVNEIGTYDLAGADIDVLAAYKKWNTI